MRKTIQENPLLLTGILLSVLFFSGFLIMNDQIFIFEGDVLNQNVKMTLQAWERLRDGSGFLWNWSNFLGANYLGTATYYGFGSPFFWIMMAAPDQETVISMFLYTNILKAILCTTGGYFWLKKVSKSQEGAFVGSLIVSFSGFVLTNYNNNVMFDAICLMPLCLYFTERFLQEDRSAVLLALNIGLIGLTNYYFLYLFLPFLGFYALFRYGMLQPFVWKIYLKKAMSFLGLILLGIGVSAVLLLPSFFALINNPRSASLPGLFETISKFDLYRLITGFLNPINDWRINNNYYVNTSIYEGIGYSGGMAVYSFMIFPYLAPLLLTLKKSRVKTGMILFYALYGIFCLFKVFYVLFNQNLETRWMMNLIFLNALLVAILISQRNLIPKKAFLGSFLAVSLLILGCLWMTHHFYLSPDLWGWKIIVRNALIGIGLLGVYTILFVVNKKTLFTYGLILCLATELAFSYYNIFYNDGYQLDPMTQEELDQYQLFENPVIEQIQKNDSGFYRIDQMTLQTLHENDSYLYNYHSFNGYTSIYNYNQIPFIDERFKVSYAWNFYPQPGKWLLKLRLGSKYFIQYDEQDQIPYGSRFLFEEGKTTVYQNDFALPFAYAKQGEISNEALQEYSIFMQDRILINNIARENPSKETDTSLIDSLVLVAVNGQDSFQVDVSNLTEGMLYVEFTTHTSVSYEIYDQNDEMIDYNYLIRDLNYAVIPLPENAVRVGITVLSPVNVYYDDLAWFEDWYQQTMEYAVEETRWTENSISGTIELKENASIFTSIPYDPGWQLYVDQESHSWFVADEGFIGVDLEAGIHTLEFVFVPQGLKGGALISIVSLLVLLTLCYKKRICKMIGK